MKADNHLWNRLSRLAKLAPPAPIPDLPLGFDTRVLAACRASLSSHHAPYWELVFRRALLAFTLLMVISLAANYITSQRLDTDELIEMSQTDTSYIP